MGLRCLNWEHAVLACGRHFPSSLRQEILKVNELRFNPFGPRIVALFSEDGSGELNFQNFINMMSVFSSRVTAEAKMVWAFALWDFDGEAYI
jgi:Ca2+-binding EF-hand superfamily protein